MHDTPLLRDFVILLAASLPVVFVTRRLGLPALVGFLVTGFLLGPGLSGAIESVERVQQLAEIGVILLLFTIGLEFSLARLTKMARLLVGAGCLQLGSTAVLVALSALIAGHSGAQASVLGLVAALSSTALALAMLDSRGELNATYAGPTLAVLLFQDLCVVPVLMALPVLAGAEAFSATAVLGRFVLGMGGVLAAGYVARSVLPQILHQVLRLRSRELFIGVVVLACFGTAWLTATLGLSLAIGAFLAGLVVSESEYSHQIVADVLPLRDLFGSVFFLSIGMLVDPATVIQHPVLIVSLSLAVMAIKATLAGFSVLPFRASPGAAILAGVALAQVGEFSFVITTESARLGLLSAQTVQLVVAVSVVTMMLTPLAMSVAARVVTARELPGLEPDAELRLERPPHGHVVVVGYGHNGRNLVRVLKEAGVPYRAVDVDFDAVRAGKQDGEIVVFGDATRPVVLEYVHADSAAVIAITFSYPEQARRLVAAARRINPSGGIIARTRYVDEMDELYALGANDVIPEEFEATVDMFARILGFLEIPRNIVAAQVDVIRSRHYAMLRGKGGGSSYLESLYDLFTAATVATHLVRAESPGVGRTLDDLDLEGRTGTSLVAIVRRGQPVTTPPREFTVEKGDILVITGSHGQLARAGALMEPVVAEEEARA
jgi:monovalent cation:H+ antiporter-2, CPA2 family